ncbi:hypothetical protein HELRODRAFT_103401, partial [Helobdella robusta]|uniref:DWNN domain-containing protein n=1 Tax=Helobdella robusta TaxID=6412 RepID=T1EDG0_HELRO
MTSTVHFKFKSSLEFETLSFTGSEISVADLKKEIINIKNMGKLMENFDLNITNAQTREDYKPDAMVPRNSSVVVARVPVLRSSRRDNLRRDLAASPTKIDDTSSPLEILSKTKDIASLEISEEEKIRTMMEQSNKDFANVNYNRVPRMPTGPVPRNYVCHRCGLPGHYIQNCPRFKDPNSTETFPRLKRSTGIPNSFMTTVHDINTPGVLLTSSGQLAVPTIDAAAYKEGKKEKPPFVKDTNTAKKPDPNEKLIPNELLCPICKDILVDVVVAPCCGESACDECIRHKILASDNHQCPICKETNVSPDDLIANNLVRAAVINYQ